MSDTRRSPSLVLASSVALLAVSVAGGCADAVPPSVETVPLGDTRDELGPYTVTAVVLEHRGLFEVRLHHRDSDAERGETIVMEEVLPGRFEAGIPGRVSGTRVHWFVEAEDIYGNIGHAPLFSEWGDSSCVDAVPTDGTVPEGGAAYCFLVLR